VAIREIQELEKLQKKIISATQLLQNYLFLVTEIGWLDFRIFFTGATEKLCVLGSRHLWTLNSL